MRQPIHRTKSAEFLFAPNAVQVNNILNGNPRVLFIFVSHFRLVCVTISIAQKEKSQTERKKQRYFKGTIERFLIGGRYQNEHQQQQQRAEQLPHLDLLMFSIQYFLCQRRRLRNLFFIDLCGYAVFVRCCFLRHQNFN